MGKERIVMVNEIVENDSIIVTSESTNFCRIERAKFPSIAELEKEVKALRKELTKKGVGLGRTNTLKILRDRKNEYAAMVNEYNETFDSLVKAWKKKVKKGIYPGCADDKDLNETIYPLAHKLTRMNYRSTLLSQISEIAYDVKRTKRELDFGTNFIKVSI